MARLLGISVRAVQSYEQGWRPLPPYVQKLAGMLLFLSRNGDEHLPPCWEVNGCGEEQKSRCFAYKHGIGRLCWMATGNWHQADNLLADWRSKLARCRECEVMRRWTG